MRIVIYDIGAPTSTCPTNSESMRIRHLLDDVRHIHARDRALRRPTSAMWHIKEPFHGMKTLRTNSIEEGDLLALSGFLVHGYLREPNGDTSRCVALKDTTVLEARIRSDATRSGAAQRVSAP